MMFSMIALVQVALRQGVEMNTTKARLRFNFWLDIRRDDEFAVAEQIQLLKRQRAFAKTVRDGIRLICDLRAGNVDVLLELFPFVQSKLTPQTPPPADNSDLKREIQMLKDLMLHSATPPMVAAPVGILRSSASTIGGPKPLSAPKFDLPRFEDDDEAETLILTKDTRTNSAQNFLDSMLALQQ
jgi:hypothetical protein